MSREKGRVKSERVRRERWSEVKARGEMNLGRKCE